MSEPQPTSTELDDLIRFGWSIAQDTLAGAASELTLVTHWFHVPGDSSVNRDEHFGSDERTHRFLSVALPTLIDQLGARHAVVVLPWGLSSDGDHPGDADASDLASPPAPTLSVIAVRADDAGALEARIAARTLTRLEAGPGPPFWRLEPDIRDPPSHLAATASRWRG